MGRLTREDWRDDKSVMWERVDNMPIGDTEKKAIKDALRKLAAYEDLEGKAVVEVIQERANGEVTWRKDTHMPYIADMEEVGKTIFLSRADADAEIARLEKERYGKERTLPDDYER